MPNPSDHAVAPFAPARRLRSLDDVSRQLRDAILAGDVAEGERLPNERDLADRFEVGRPTVREALRSLEALGIVEIRPGRAGGAYAIRPNEATLGSALSTLVNLRGATAQELAEFRLSFEADNAWWAAKRADADDVAALEALVAETRRLPKQITGDWTPLTEADARWHETLAHATKNRLRIGIALGLHDLRLRQVAALGAAHARYARTIPTALATITKAVKEQQAEAARSSMLHHIEQWARLNPEIPDLNRPE